MPIHGHLPYLGPLGLNICTPCRAGDHRNCRDIWEPARRRAVGCECLGPLTPNTPTCLPERP